MSDHILYVDNTGYIQLEGYKNGLTGEYINDAIVNAEFTDLGNNSITGLLPSVSLNYESGTSGNYSASISENADWNIDDIVNVKVAAISSGIKSVFNCKVRVIERSC